MDEYVIKVTTGQLQTVSNTVTGKVLKVQQAFMEIDAVVEASAQYWEGKGNAAMRNDYKSRKADYEKIFREINDHVQKLQVIAGVYNEAEQMNFEEAYVLPGDVIV